MGKRNFLKTGFVALSGGYPTREALESGLLFPSYTKPRGLGCNRSVYSDPSFDMESMWDEAEGCAAPVSLRSHTACEFRDFCNHLYTAEFTCDCEVAWKKRAGLALPTSA